MSIRNMISKRMRLGFGLVFLFSLNCSASEYIIQSSVPGVVATATPDKGVYSSCKELKLFHPNYASGSYTITPEIGATGARTLYCDMTTDGGGWTLVAKQSNFQSSNFRIATLNTTSLADLSFNVTSPGGIQNLFAHNQVMLLSDSANYMVFNSGFSDLTQTPCSGYGLHSCESISRTIIKKNGLSNIPNNALLVFTNNSEVVSGIIIGDESSNPWCYIINGRYNGVCRNGNYGIGNWAVFVR